MIDSHSRRSRIASTEATRQAAQTAKAFGRLNVASAAASPASSHCLPCCSSRPTRAASPHPPRGHSAARIDHEAVRLTVLAAIADDWFRVAAAADLLRELVPGAKKVALLTNPANPGAVKEQEAMEAASSPLNMTLTTFKASGTSEIDRAFDQIQPGKFDALAVVADAFLISRRDKIVGLAAQRNLPAIYPSREFTEGGGLASYGTRWADMYVIVGAYAGRILKGAKPADLPVQRPTSYELVINNRTAKSLNLTLSQILLARADEVIE